MALNFANNNSLSAITTKPSGLSGGALNLISTQTASSSSTISFTSGIDSTYDEYVFKFYDIHPSASANLEFNATTDGTNFNVVKTSSAFYTTHREDGTGGALGYSGIDEAQATGFQQLTTGDNVATQNDGSIIGVLQIFNPSNTTFVKHFISQTNFMGDNSGTYGSNGGYVAGYFNTTSALTGFQFKMRSGNLDSGVIKLYGVS